METMDVRGKKTNENSLAAKVRMDMKGTPSPVVNEKKGKKELLFDSSTSPLTNKEKDRIEQSSGHLTSPLKANQEENTKKSLLSHLTPPLKTNKEQDMKESKIKPSSKRSRKMATNIDDIMSSTALPTIGINKRQKKCQQEIPSTRLKGSQPVKKNTNEITQTSLSKPKVQDEKVLRVLEYLDDVIQYLGNNGCVMKAYKLPIKRLKWLPVQEPGSDDCGVHTAKYFDLEQFNGEEAAKFFISAAISSADPSGNLLDDCFAIELLLLSRCCAAGYYAPIAAAFKIVSI
ncbi:hypothetical protein RHSIM_Rhsim11G0070800 [Rhododendron simsii]|uniref:Uncharacterized protein n=1 Tax=Rhododendron simsii TaxID=118357 RepID=A0A834G738_RHOSS|nr:hypothetical protein RHSIM_Rhsim11G0070800 [Rhododendron simsii]